MKLEDIITTKLDPEAILVADYPGDLEFLANDLDIKENEIHINPKSFSFTYDHPLRVKDLQILIDKYPNAIIKNKDGIFSSFGYWEGGEGGDYCLSGNALVLYHEGIKVPNSCRIKD